MKNQALFRHYQFADGMMLLVNAGLFVFSLTLATFYNTWLESILIGGGTVGALTAIYYLSKGSIVSRVSMATGFMVLAALHIHQMNGMIEMHFGIFVLLAILLFYRDWLPIIVAAAVTAIHHIAFFFMQTNGMEVWVLPSGSNNFFIIILHAGYVIAESALLVYMAASQRREYNDASELMNLTNQIVSEEGLDLTPRTTGESQLLERFDLLMNSFTDLTKQAKQSAQVLDENGISLERVTKEMVDVSHGQDQSTQHISERMSQFRESVALVTGNANSALAKARSIDQNAKSSMNMSIRSRDGLEALVKHMSETGETISNLHRNSESISSVLDVIRGIAEQTNLLALNAAIEAARAGEQGRGFAVVADEVRTLAQRTQTSTHEIDQMIEALQVGSESSVAAITASQKDVGVCLADAEECQRLISEMSEELDGLARASQNIASKTDEQLASIESIGTSLDELAVNSRNSVTESEKTAETGHEIRKLASYLVETVSRFKV